MNITPTQHERSEWARMAEDAKSTGRHVQAHIYLAWASRREEMPLSQFDELQKNYRAWLVFGWNSVDNHYPLA